MSHNKNLTKPCFKTVDGDEWIVFPDSIPPPLQHPKDCVDAIFIGGIFFFLLGIRGVYFCYFPVEYINESLGGFNI